jgi:hypothetical protein
LRLSFPNILSDIEFFDTRLETTNHEIKTNRILISIVKLVLELFFIFFKIIKIAIEPDINKKVSRGITIGSKLAGFKNSVVEIKVKIK